MTTISPLSSSLLQMLAGNDNSSAGGVDSSLLAGTGNAPQASGTSSSDLLQTLVTLTSSKGSANASSLQTYNAQGLLNQVQAAMPQDPLFSTGSSSDSSSTDSLLGGILGTGQNSDGSTASASGGASATNLLQLFQQSPTLAAAYVEGQSTQSIFSDLA